MWVWAFRPRVLKQINSLSSWINFKVRQWSGAVLQYPCHRTNRAAGGIVQVASDWPVGLLARCRNGRF